MFNSKILIFSLLLSIFCNQSSGIEWKKNRKYQYLSNRPVKAIKLDVQNNFSYEDCLKLAKEKNKKIFVFFYIDSCHWCHKMIDETLSDPSCKEGLKNLIVYYYNPEFEKEHKNIKMFPSYHIIDSNENIIKKGQKFMKASDFLKWLAD